MALGGMVAPTALLICASASAQSTTAAPAPHIDTITVEAARQRAVVERQVRAFVAQIAVKPYESSLARWQTVVPMCPLVAANPDALLKAWNKRDVWMFGDEADQGGTKIRKFLNSNSPIRVWYNAELYSDEGTPLGNVEGRANLRGRATRIVFNETRDLTSALIMVDGSRTRGVKFGQLASYIAMLGLAEIRADADVADAPSILHLFSRAENDRPPGLSSWDEAFLKALYHTEQTDKQQLGEIKTTMIEGLLPR
jgi:hypothetical protein